MTADAFRRALLPVVLPLIGAALVPGAPAPAQEVSYTGSLQYSTGAYVFQQRTHSVYLISGLGVRGDRLELSGSLPVVLQNSTVVTWVQGMPVPTGGPDHEALRRREPGSKIPTRRGGGGMGPGGRMAGSAAVLPGQTGPGTEATDSVTFSDEFGVNVADPYLSGSVEAFSGLGTVRSVRFSAGTKIPLADVESGVGTGEWDYAAGTSLTLGLGGVYLFGDVTWWWLGDLPELELEDGLSYGVGAGGSVLDGRATVLATVSGAQSSVATVDPPVMAGVSLGYTLREGRSLSLGLSAGLTESSPDVSLYLGWTLGG